MQSELSKTTMQPTDPDASPPEVCANCGAPLYGKYCYACGQPTHGLVRHFGSVLSDVADSVLNIDERLFRTLAPLYLRPGKLTLDYFAGKRARYVTPFRLVFFIAIIVFFALQLSLRIGFSHTGPMRTVKVSSTNGISVKPYAPPKNNQNNPFAEGDISINHHVIWNRQTKPLRIGWLPGAANDWLNELIGNAQTKLREMTSGSAPQRQAVQRQLILHMLAAAPTVVFLLLPLFALQLKIFYLFKRRLYMEHLIVAMHSQAFVLLSLLVLAVLGVLNGWLVPKAGWLNVPIRLAIAAAWIWTFVYLFLMQKRVYRQGWFMTTVKYCSVGFCYLVLIGFGWAFAVLISLTNA